MGAKGRGDVSGAAPEGVRRRRVRRAGLLAAAAAVAAPALFAVLSFAFIGWDPEPAERYPGGTLLLDADGELMRVTLGPGDTDCRPTYQASRDDLIVKALVASEDGSFWTHCGVRPLSIARAAFQNVFYRRRVSGASTITMQAVRLIEPHRKSYWQKWVEAVKAVKMERARSKEWIISQYLNRAPFGSNFVGIEAAARGWFSRGAKELGLGEAAFLAGMVQAPSRYRPDRGYERAVKRRDYVLKRMLECGYITEDQLDGARSVKPVVSRAKRPFRHPYYCDWFMKELERRPGGALPPVVRTPLEPDVQQTSERAVDEAAASGGYSVAAVAMRGDEVVALACSGDYFDKDSGQVNTATAPRPAGSTLKPFLAALALDLGIAAPSSRLSDAPKPYKGYRPANFDSKTRGAVSLRDALVLSLNLPFLELLSRVGIERFAHALRRLGFEHMGADDASFGLGMAIGNVEVTLVELARAYRRLAAGDVFSRGASFLVAEMLSGPERSGAAFGHVADVRTARFAWKTGTSAAYRDAWTVLWNPECTIAVWAGHKRGGFGDASLVGAHAAAPVAWRIARSLYPQGSGPWFVRPEGEIAMRTVCAASGQPPSPFCGETEEAEYLVGRTLFTPCASCKPQAAKPPLAILKPEDGAEFRLVPGFPQQRVVFEATGAAGGERVWWFVDGAFAGACDAGGKFAASLEAGEHDISCAAADGRSASVSVSVSAAAERELR